MNILSEKFTVGFFTIKISEWWFSLRGNITDDSFSCLKSMLLISLPKMLL